MHRCRNCGADVSLVFADLGMQPLANHFLTAQELHEGETFYPLRAVVCEQCWLVQLEDVPPREAMFTDYAYRSGQSDSWVAHCRGFAETMMERFAPQNVLEIASNDGTLLKQFQAEGVQHVLGVEPAYNVAKQAEWAGVPTMAEYWGRQAATTWAPGSADLVVAMNVLAHVPDLDDFVGGITDALAPQGVVVFEFPWLWRLIENFQWDTIYHEHHSYLSLLAVTDILNRRGLIVTDAVEVPTHGGSLRVTASWMGQATNSLKQLREFEDSIGLDRPELYQAFATLPAQERERARAKLCGRQLRTVGYGAAAKGTTFLNYCGIGAETMPFIVDSTPEKQGKFTAGSHIPVLSPDALEDERPSRIVILPWNWRAEIEAKIKAQCDWYPEILTRPFTGATV